jgi:hypothetical protein
MRHIYQCYLALERSGNIKGLFVCLTVHELFNNTASAPAYTALNTCITSEWISNPGLPGCIMAPAATFVSNVKFSRYRPTQALGDPEGRGFRIFSTFGTIKVVRSSPLRTSRLYPQEFSWYSFLEAESTPGHMVPSVASEKIPSDTTGDRSRDPPTSSTVP